MKVLVIGNNVEVVLVATVLVRAETLFVVSLVKVVVGVSLLIVEVEAVVTVVVLTVELVVDVVVTSGDGVVDVVVEVEVEVSVVVVVEAAMPEMLFSIIYILISTLDAQ